MKYCAVTTCSHPVLLSIEGVLKCIDGILVDEGCDVTPSPFFSKNIKVIDGDELEKKYSKIIQRGSFKKSVDLIFGLNTGVFQLVELKFKSDTFKYLNKSSFNEKIEGSTEILGSTTGYSKKHILIFQVSKKNQAINYLFRQYPRLSPEYKVLDVNELYNLYFK